MTLIDEYHEELEIDLLRQGIDLLDFWRGRLTARRLELLIRHLPADSAFVAAAFPDTAELAKWNSGEHLLADLFDVLVAVNTDPKRGKPKWHPRPGDEIRERKRQEARAAALERQQARIRARAEQEQT